MQEKASRLELARIAASELLAELETDSSDIAQSLMRAKRLARLLRDEDAQTWLDLELRGYPPQFSFATLGTCQRYAQQGGRVTFDGKYYTKSLPEIEADWKGMSRALDQMAGSEQPSSAAADFVAARATEQLVNNARKYAIQLRKAYSSQHALYSAMRSAIHSYAADCNIALELGDAVDSLFEAARTTVAAFVGAHVPAAAQQLLAIADRLRDGDSESLSAALTSCRRLLAAVADAVFPPQTDPYVDTSGQQRRVGPDEYKNRLLAFLEQRLASSGTIEVLAAELEHLAARLDAVYDKVCKGVHADVTATEARLAVIHTYLLVAEVARAAIEPGATAA